MLALSLLFAAAALIAWCLCAIQEFERDAELLHLCIKGPDMAKIGDTFTATIAPTTADGSPAVVNTVVYAFNPEVYDVQVSDDSLSAVFTAKAGGKSQLRVTARSLGGVDLADEKALPDVEAAPVPDLEAAALNLTIA
jgi:hypothetical protein